MTELAIGTMVRRDESGSRWHLVDSVVDHGAFTNCGRRMRGHLTSGDHPRKLIVRDAVEVSEFDSGAICRTCAVSMTPRAATQ